MCKIFHSKKEQFKVHSPENLKYHTTLKYIPETKGLFNPSFEEN